MRQGKDKVKDGDERVRATIEMILRDYVPQPDEPLAFPDGLQAARMEASPLSSIEPGGQPSALGHAADGPWL
jgi:hypothetical protein